jgi:hypothetical protein
MLRPFLDAEHAALRNLETSRGEVSNVVFLTPGYRHPSYFEHAYKARLLGVSLVEAADLTVRERRLFLKTLGGLRRVDGVICRLDEDGIDPLEFWTSGGRGVPGLIEAWRSGNVALLNSLLEEGQAEGQLDSHGQLRQEEPPLLAGNMTLLHHAAARGVLSTASVLIEKWNFDVDARDSLDEVSLLGMERSMK